MFQCFSLNINFIKHTVLELNTENKLLQNLARENLEKTSNNFTEKEIKKTYNIEEKWKKFKIIMMKNNINIQKEENTYVVKINNQIIKNNQIKNIIQQNTDSNT